MSRGYVSGGKCLGGICPRGKGPGVHICFLLSCHRHTHKEKSLLLFTAQGVGEWWPTREGYH